MDISSCKDTVIPTHWKIHILHTFVNKREIGSAGTEYCTTTKNKQKQTTINIKYSNEPCSIFGDIARNVITC